MLVDSVNCETIFALIIIIVRLFILRFLSNQQCLSYLQHWLNVSHGLGTNTVRPGAVFIRSLVRAFYGTLPFHLRSQFVKALPHKLSVTLIITLDGVYGEVSDYLPCVNRIHEHAIVYSRAVLNNFIPANWYLMVSFFVYICL